MQKPYEKPAFRDLTAEEARAYGFVNEQEVYDTARRLADRDTEPAPPDCDCHFPEQAPPAGQQWTHAPSCWLHKP